jgi:hypothetical protein
MTPTRRGRVVFAVIVALAIVGGVVAGVLALGGRGKPSEASGPGGSTSSVSPGSTPSASPPPPICPLTGLTPASGRVPNRPALAVKVENLPSARPQTGLGTADIVYEEPVEGGVTRFIAVYQCQDAARIEPVRSARFTDPDILVQFGHPLFGYAGGVPSVRDRVRERGLIDVNYLIAVRQYHRDPARPAPHNLYTSTRELYGFKRNAGGPPQPIFEYSKKAPKTAKKVSQAHLPFSTDSDVFWKWNSSKKAWLRYHGDVPHTLSDGTQVSAVNVVIQVVKTELTDVTDANGVHSPKVISVGTGTAYVLRNGKLIKGTWSRPALSDITVFKDAKGNVIKLAPGNTWVELYPDDRPAVTFTSS